MAERALFKWANGYLRSQSPTVLITSGVTLVLFIGTLDYLTGTELSISIFYLLPIALMVWFVNRRRAVLFSIFSSTVGLATDLLAGHRYSHPIILYWNNAVQLGFFVIIVLLLSALRTEYEETVKLNADLQRTLDALERTQVDLERKTQDLARSNKELENFGYMAAHDLKAPLIVVGGYIHRLKRLCKGTLDSNAERLIEHALEGTTRMESLINSLLAYARVGTKNKETKVVNCDDVVKRALTNLQVEIERAGARITHDELPTLLADDVQMSQLFQNLIGNGIKFRRTEPPSVHISAERREEEWVFSIRDNGIGINPQDADRIFEIFERLDNGSEYQGCGIGLAICRKIVQNYGGRIWVLSERGKGSTFYFALPTNGPALTKQK